MSQYLQYTSHAQNHAQEVYDKVVRDKQHVEWNDEGTRQRLEKDIQDTKEAMREGRFLGSGPACCGFFFLPTSSQHFSGHGSHELTL